jgi:hypothetical protein
MNDKLKKQAAYEAAYIVKQAAKNYALKKLALARLVTQLHAYKNITKK